jgi:uncharacterized protein YndB with AHSA1/START domain
MPTQPSLTIRRRLRASPGKVFAAWTDPRQVMRWWGPAGAETVRAEMDPRVGGRFLKVARTADGEEHEASGVYREVIPDEKLVFTWAWRDTPERETLVTVALRPDGDGTILTLTHEQFADEPTRDRHNAGWSGALDKLERYLS